MLFRLLWGESNLRIQLRDCIQICFCKELLLPKIDNYKWDKNVIEKRRDEERKKIVGFMET